jgi:hypothetical protein
VPPATVATIPADLYNKEAEVFQKKEGRREKGEAGDNRPFQISDSASSQSADTRDPLSLGHNSGQILPFDMISFFP